MMSSPRTFNDPFDCQFDFGFQFTFESYVPAFIDAILEMILSDKTPLGNHSDETFKMIEIMRQKRPQPSRLEYKNFMQQTASQLITNLNKAQEMVSHAWAAKIDELRILCLSETNDNLLMWAHYAEQHKGAVVRLGCIRERDSVLLAALPVIYTDQVPYIATMEEWIRHQTGQQSINYEAYLYKMLTTKSKQWKEEREWRVITLRDPDDKGSYNYNYFWPEEIEAVYFGCCVTDSEIKSVVEKMHPSLSHVELYKARKKKWEFGLEFKRIR